MNGRRRACLVVMSLATAAALALPAGASAHAVLVRAQPSDGSTLAGAPRVIRLQFSEEISPRFRLARLVDERGRVVAGTTVRAEGRSLALATPRLKRGTYEVLWDVLAEDDGHVTSGAVVFGVGARPSGTHLRRGLDSAPPPIDVALRWLDFALVAFLVGALVVSFLLGRSGGAVAGAATRRVLRWAWRSAALALALGVVVLAREAHGLLVTLPRGSTWLDALGQLLTARWGVLWLVREALLGALLVITLRGRGRPVAYQLALAFAVGVVVCRALGAHAASVRGSGLPVLADAAHVLAACVWIGGVLALAVALWPTGAVGRSGSAALARECRGRFARVAALSVGVLGATGLYEAGVQVASVDGLLTTLYGQTLLVKVALAAGAGALGLANFVLFRPRLMLLEATVGLEVLVAAAILTATSPPRGPEFRPPEPVRAPTLVRQVGDVVVTATARPNRPGTNVFAVTAASARRPPPAPIDNVALALAPEGGGRGAASEVRLSRVAPGRYSGGAELAQDGRWRMTLVLRRGAERLTARFGWPVQPPDPARPVRYSSARLAPLVAWPAALSLLLALAGGLWMVPRALPTPDPT